MSAGVTVALRMNARGAAALWSSNRRTVPGTFLPPEPAFERDRDWWYLEALDPLEILRERGEPTWRNWAARCTECQQGWLAANDDDFYLRRLADSELRAIELMDQWPDHFDS